MVDEFAQNYGLSPDFCLEIWILLGPANQSQDETCMWVFPKIGVPQNGWFAMEIPIKMDDLGGKPTIFGNIHVVIVGFVRQTLTSSSSLELAFTPIMD